MVVRSSGTELKIKTCFTTLGKDLVAAEAQKDALAEGLGEVCFTDFINRLRIEHACNLLERGSNITDIAFSSGFSSIRTFNRILALVKKL